MENYRTTILSVCGTGPRNRVAPHPGGVLETDPYPGPSSTDVSGGTRRYANWVFFEYDSTLGECPANEPAVGI